MAGACLHFGKSRTFVCLDVRAQSRPRDSGRHGLEIMFEGVGICEQRRGLNVVDVRHPCGLTNTLMKSEKARAAMRRRFPRFAAPAAMTSPMPDQMAARRRLRPISKFFYGPRSGFFRGERPVACAAAEAATALEISAPSAIARIVNFNRGIARKNILILQRRAVLELPAVVLVAVRRAMLAAFREPSRRNRIGQRNAARINRPGATVDRRLIEYPAATPAGKGEPRTASRSNRFYRTNFPVVRSPRRQPFIAHIVSRLNCSLFTFSLFMVQLGPDTVTRLRGAIAGAALGRSAALAFAAIFLSTGFLGTVWIDVNFAALEFGAAEEDGGVNRVVNFDHFHEAESPGFAGELVGDH